MYVCTTYNVCVFGELNTNWPASNTAFIPLFYNDWNRRAMHVSSTYSKYL